VAPHQLLQIGQSFDFIKKATKSKARILCPRAPEAQSPTPSEKAFRGIKSYHGAGWAASRRFHGGLAAGGPFRAHRGAASQLALGSGPKAARWIFHDLPTYPFQELCMNKTPRTLWAAACLGLAALTAQAQVPADAPAGTTVQCKDGAYASPDAKAGACRGHKGIKTWYGKGTASAAPAAAAAPTASPAAAAPALETQSASVDKTGVAPSTGTATRTPGAPDLTKMAATPGGGAGKVWANDETKVYHCMGDRYYGKTKKGEYLSEADAKAKGMHASHNKTCTS
jgi:hypothetical protein